MISYKVSDSHVVYAQTVTGLDGPYNTEHGIRLAASIRYRDCQVGLV